MRDPARIEKIIDKLHFLWSKSPDMRFLQMIENLFGCHRINCLYYREDYLLEEKLDLVIEKGWDSIGEKIG